jgi:hypothetical protein
MIMKLPIKTNILGDEITICENELSGKLGQWDEAEGTITIHKNQPEYGKRIILIHEVLHVVETIMLQQGILKKRINHDFIHNAAFGICALLTAAGMIEGMSEEDIYNFIANQQANEQITK